MFSEQINAKINESIKNIDDALEKINETVYTSRKQLHEEVIKMLSVIKDFYNQHYNLIAIFEEQQVLDREKLLLQERNFVKLKEDFVDNVEKTIISANEMKNILEKNLIKLDWLKQEDLSNILTQQESLENKKTIEILKQKVQALIDFIQQEVNKNILQLQILKESNVLNYEEKKYLQINKITEKLKEVLSEINQNNLKIIELLITSYALKKDELARLKAKYLELEKEKARVEEVRQSLVKTIDTLKVEKNNISEKFINNSKSVLSQSISTLRLISQSYKTANSSLASRINGEINELEKLNRNLTTQNN